MVVGQLCECRCVDERNTWLSVCGLSRWTATALKSPACVILCFLFYLILFSSFLFLFLFIYLQVSSLCFYFSYLILFFTKLNEILPPINLLAFVCLFTWACFPLGWSMATCSGRREHGVGQGVKLLLNSYKSVHKVPFGVSLLEPSSVQFR